MSVRDRFEINEGVLTAFTGEEDFVRIPEGVTEIGEGVFKGMAWIRTVELPGSLKKIGAYAFKGCRQLKNISFPEGLLQIGEYAFHRCHGIEEMIFPISVTKVESHAFLYCDNLRRVVLEGPKRLEKAVFSHDISLTEVALNADLDDSNFHDEVFEGCVRLRKITLSGKSYEVDNLIEAMDSHSEYPGIIRSIAGSVFHSLQIEDGVLKSFNINLRSISVPEGITAIGKSCFYDKKGIVNITFPRSLRQIRDKAFLNCTGLEEITLQSEDISLYDKAFRGCCGLKKVNIAGKSFLLENETEDETVSRIRDQVLGDFYISGRILIRYMGDEEQITIPKEVEIISERCFFANERLKIVICPENLKEIREQAFAGCVTLQSVILPDKLKRVEREAFAECKKLLKCNLPASVEYIGEYAFRRCFALKTFEPWPKAAVIERYAFYRAKNFEGSEEKLNFPGTGYLAVKDLTKEDTGIFREDASFIAPYAHAHSEDINTLTLSDVKEIGPFAYFDCPNLEEVVIDAPECVIGDRAFADCPKLKKIRLRVKELGEGCFSYCRKLEDAGLLGISVLPAGCFAGCYELSLFKADGLRRIGARCFDECIGLAAFDFSQIGYVGERAFERCDSLKDVKLGQTECAYHSFADCSGLESVEISADTVLKSGAFTGCTQITSITFESKKYEFGSFADGLNHAGNPYSGSVREVISSVYSCFEISDLRKLTGYLQDASKVTLPADVEEVGPDVFRDHARLGEINIPGSVKIFGSHAFSQTGWLEKKRESSEMVIVNDVLIDGARCKGKVVLPVSVKRVASWCFAGNTDITQLEIPSENIAIEALSFRNCLNLKRITDWDKKEYVFGSIRDLTGEDYPELIGRIFSECVNCFKMGDAGKLIESTGNITDLTFPEGITGIGDNVYKDCHLLESLKLSDDTVSIGRSAFENSKWLKRVKNAGAVEDIGPMAFSGCQSLETIELSDALKHLGNRCFEHCSSLKEITLSEKLEAIPERAFFRCRSIKKLFIPAGVKLLGTECCAFCADLEEVHIPKDAEVAQEAFLGCDRVKIYRY